WARARAGSRMRPRPNAWRTRLRKPPNETVKSTGARPASPSLPREGLGVGSAEGGRNSDSEEASLRSSTHPRPLPSREGSAEPERTCVLTRTARPREALIRLALSPDGEILPDVRAKAPG